MTTCRSGDCAFAYRPARAAAGEVAHSVPPAIATPAAPAFLTKLRRVNLSCSCGMVLPPSLALWILARQYDRGRVESTRARGKEKGAVRPPSTRPPPERVR